MKYLVSGSKRVVTDVDDMVEADSPHAAVELFRKAHPGVVPDAVELGDEFWPVEGRCESCEGTILAGDKFGRDEDSVTVCEKCFARL